MTNEELIVKIKTEFERRIKILREDKVVRQNCTSNFLEGKIFGYEQVLSFLSTLESGRPVPADLEEAAGEYSFNIPSKLFHHLSKEQQILWKKEIEQAYLAGAERDREQMMKEAVEADVNIYRDIVAGKSWAEFVVEMPTNNLGDKVRIIIEKED